MSAVNIKRGERPWAPALGAHLVDVYDRYNMPLTGVFEYAEDDYLFHCLFGHDDDIHLWAYVRLDDLSRRLLEAAEGDAFDAQVDRALLHRHIAWAFADDDGVALFGELADSGQTRGDLMRAVLEEVGRRLAHYSSDQEDMAREAVLA